MDLDLNGQSTPPTAGERRLSTQIFAVSAGLVGVCLTVVGLFNALRTPSMTAGIADNLVAIDSLLFLGATAFAYLALRVRRERYWRRLERTADLLFLVALLGMVAVCGLVAFEYV
jgi:hypothetical protein